MANIRTTVLILLGAAACGPAVSFPASWGIPWTTPGNPVGVRTFSDSPSDSPVSVNPATGELFLWEDDRTFPSDPCDALLKRFYHTPMSGQEKGLFGRAWRTLLERRLMALDDGFVLVDQWGGQTVFRRTEPGWWWAERGPARCIEAAKQGPFLHDNDARQWQFDAAGRLIAVRESSGRTLVIERDGQSPMVIRRICSADSAERHWIGLEMNGEGLISRVQCSDGTTVAYRYEGGRLVAVERGASGSIRYDYDRAGHLTQITQSGTVALRVKCDGQGSVLSLAGRGIAPRTYSYSPPREPGQPPSGGTRTNGVGQVLQWRRSAGGKRVEWNAVGTHPMVMDVTARDCPAQLQLGSQTLCRWEYDARGRLTARDGPGAAAVRLSYAGNAIHPQRIVHGDGTTLRIEYDPAKRAGSLAVAGFRPWTFGHDEMGRLVDFEDFFHERHRIAYDDNCRMASLTASPAAVYRIGRDSQGRIVSFAAEGGPLLRFVRNEQGRVVEATDGVESVAFGYDGRGNLAAVSGSQGYRRRIEYTDDGLPSLIPVAKDASIRFTYDGERQCVALQRGDRATVQIAREGAGHVAAVEIAGGLGRWSAKSDGWGRPIAFQKKGRDAARVESDAVGRVQAVQTPSGGRALSLDYDAFGRLMSLETPLVRYRFSRDPLDRPQAIVETAAARRDTFAYDGANRLIRRNTPGWTEQYRYDASGRLTAMDVIGVAVASYKFTYNAQGALQGIGWPNDVRSACEYDSSRRLARLAVRNAQGQNLLVTPVDYATSSRLAAATGTGSERFAYRFDSALLPTEIAHATGERDVFLYGPSGSLTAAIQDGRRESIEHDGWGRLVGAGEFRYEYRNTPSDETPKTSATTILILDDWERVIGLARGDGLKARYEYLPDGRMIRREVNGDVTTYDWDGPRLRSVADKTGRMIAGVQYDPVWGLPLAVTMGAQTYYCHTDVFGQVAVLTDVKGNPVEEPEGFPLLVRPPDAPPISPAWTGLPPAVWLPEEELLLVEGRLLEPTSGDWLSPDVYHYLERKNPYRPDAPPRPLEFNRGWENLIERLAWVERLESGGSRASSLRPGLAHSLASLARLVRAPECLEEALRHAAFHHDFDPDRWLDPLAANMLLGDWEWLVEGPLAPPPAPALETFVRFSPLGLIPYETCW